MQPEEYIRLAMRTAQVSNEFSQRRRMSALQNLDLLHAAMGAATESAELLDQLKKVIFYGKALDASNVREELGDILWYVALACETMGFSMEEVMDTNIKKLSIRYPEKFTSESALVRDLEAEKSVL